MILASPYSLAKALGASPSSLDGTGDEGLLEALLLLKPRTEGALGVKTLDHGNYEDTFDSLDTKGTADYQLLLGNAFLTGDPVVVTETDGSTLVPTVLKVDRYLGVVTVARYGAPTSMKVAYTSGFAVPNDVDVNDAVHIDPRFRVGIGLPEFIAEATAQAYIFWRRNTLIAPGVTKEYGFLPTLNEATIRNLKGSIYSHYMRPRFGMKFHSSHRKV
jgi:hypothetical protein